ncbi:MAG: STAS-like domain-containing protein [Burkholderiales bacterium]|nr:STAS-like domain-containing protein [Burkholderiales bacterium]
MRFVVREIVNEWENISEEAQKLHDLISPVLARGEEVEVDFEGSRAVGAPLLRGAIGELLKDHPLERVRSLLHVENLHSPYSETLELVLEKSHRYDTEPRYRVAVDRMLAEMFEDQ